MRSLLCKVFRTPVMSPFSGLTVETSKCRRQRFVSRQPQSLMTSEVVTALEIKVMVLQV